MDAVVRLASKLAPPTGALFNAHDAMAVKADAQLLWHKHDNAAGLFLGLAGEPDIELRHRTVTLKSGDLFVVAENVEHWPIARKGETHVLLIEPSGAPNTGNPATAAPRTFA